MGQLDKPYHIPAQPRGYSGRMTADSTPPTAPLPEKLQSIVDLFRRAPKPLRLQALLEYSRKLPPLPQEYIDHPEFLQPVPECASPFFLVTKEEGRAAYRCSSRCPKKPPPCAATRAF